MREEILQKKLVLYHAISSYQMLSAMTHRFRHHKKDFCILLLPDFIIEKYPYYKDLEENEVFNKVYLFPYLEIPHDENTIIQNVEQAYRNLKIFDIDKFDKIYILGGHFFFSLWLIHKKIKFMFFEDAAGMLNRTGEMKNNLSKQFPIHADLAQRNGLFDGTNKNISRVYCMYPRRWKERRFNITYELKKLQRMELMKVLLFFRCESISVEENSALLLTQQFSKLGAMTLEEQKDLYRHFFNIYLKGKYKKVYIKSHPDDDMDYRSLFNDEIILVEGCFPAELLPFIIRNSKDVDLYTISSSCFTTLKRCFRKSISLYSKKVVNGNDQYKTFKYRIDKLSKRWK